MNDPKMTADELNLFLGDVFPQLAPKLTVEAVSRNYARTRMAINQSDLRPGGTVSGPSMFALADCAFYAVTLAMIGPKALAVTTSCSINFMRKPKPHDIYAETRIMKLGKSLCVGDVHVFNLDCAEPVAHASMTYAIPQEENRVL